MEISQEEFITILKEKDKYEQMKDNLRSENEKLWDWVVWNQRPKWKIIECFMPSNNFFSCVCIKCFKSAKKDKKNVKLKLLTKESTLG